MTSREITTRAARLMPLSHAGQVLVVLSVAASAAVVGLDLGGLDGAGLVLSNVMTAAVPAGAAVACFRAARRSESLTRPWALVGAACAAWALGSAGWAWIELHGGSPNSELLVDLAYLAFYPLGVAAALSLPWQRPDRWGRAREVFEALTLMSATTFVAWAVIAEPTLEGADSGLLRAVLTTAYPVGDALLCGLLLSRFWTDAVTTRRLAAVTLGLIAVGLGDFVWGYLTARDAYTTGSTMDALYLLGFAAIGYGAALDEEEPELRPRRPMVEVGRFTVLAAPLAVLVYAQAQRQLDATLAWIAATGVACLVITQTCAQHESRALYRSLREVTTDLAHQASHDHLTGLLTRGAFTAELTEALAVADHDPSAVIFIDIDHFKRLNDTFGHDVGDEVLVRTAARVQRVLRDGDAAARFGGDEIVLLCRGVADEDRAARIADRLVRSFEDPIRVNGGELVQVGISMGVALCSNPSATTVDVVREADLALLRAKRRGRNRFELASAEPLDAIDQSARMARSIADALEEGRFHLHYQPVVRVDDGAVIGAEALVRMRDPEGNLVAPDEFIPIAEDTGLILPLGRWVLREACRTASGWDPALHIGVNVSGHQLSDHLVTDVRAALVDSCLDPSRLWIEVTETALAGDAEAASRSLTALSELGVNIALDDFGTGYSSLARLRAFPLTVLKIDRTFVQEGGESVRGRRVLAATVELAHAAGLMVVAEGVETAEQLEALRAMGCDYSQGFLHSRPVPAEELEVHVRSHVEAMA